MSGQHMAIAVVFAALLLLGIATSQRPRAQDSSVILSLSRDLSCGVYGGKVPRCARDASSFVINRSTQ